MAFEIVAVSHDADVYAARVVARKMAAEIGFDQSANEEILLVVTELATNLMRHAGGGSLSFRPVFADDHHFDSSLPSIFLGVSRACVATRGVVMAVARLDRSQNKLTFASLGNIEARVCNGSEKSALPFRRGILGYTHNMPVVSEQHWNPDSAFVVHSDGLSAHWHWNEFAFDDKPPAVIAQELLQRLARKEDDATVIVVKSAH